ncbi:hypothetical protein ZYGR_0AF01490 [Zygosaccharomyces rouxii]|uniref:Deacetylase sirtuin-type domain-containing protein n=1 Tax=Zygosaccharomyces rouxii TaxID=4956 RepID=A0A1Q3A7N1_ZYGRO|nr:hypothetical protein ZYGR_0AF01490 [Zygosaccharomyces rouxii]
MVSLLLSQSSRESSFDESDASVSSRSTPQKIPNTSSKHDLRTERLYVIKELGTKDEKLIQIHRMLNRSKKIIVLTGAGISCNAGIPDFRSSSGLYQMVKKQFPEISMRSGQEMFDISLFRDELKISMFATFMEKLYSSVRLAQPTKTHKFIAHLKNRNKLLRCYTQNIDGLEENLGLEMSTNEQDPNVIGTSFNARWKNYDVVQLHGDLNTLACTRCFHIFPWNRYWCRSFRRGELPTCPQCEEKNWKRCQEGKRQIDNTGCLRPNIVLYGENHPSSESIAQGLNLDISRGRSDFFIIMGTSLKVDGIRKVVRQIAKQVHERGGIVLLINKTSIGDSSWHGLIDYQILTDCDSWVTHLQEQLPDFFKTQETIDRQRLLKRESSELRKKKAAEQLAKNHVKTPPATPKRVKSEQEETTKNGIQNVKKRLLTVNDEIPPKKSKLNEAQVKSPSTHINF